MNHPSPWHRPTGTTPVSRREFLWRSGGGLGGIALTSLLQREALLAGPAATTCAKAKPPCR